jgi:hypothetical protein
MPRFWRITLIIIGLMVVGCSLVILAYTLLPVETLDMQATVEPTLFVVP